MQMGDPQLWRAPSTQFQMPDERGEHQTIFNQQDRVLLWLCREPQPGEWMLGTFSAHSNQHTPNAWGLF